jgi:uncharacterized delta-60 repeat protein
MLVATALAAVAASALATPGALDPTLGRRGMVAEPYGSLAAAVAAAVQPNGRIVTVGATKLSANHYELLSTRMLPDGRLDPTYGNNGSVVLSLGGTGVGNALAILRNGEILIGGAGRSAANRPLAFAAVLLHPNGQLDKSFGSADRSRCDRERDRRPTGREDPARRHRQRLS